eukprot:Opistho-1_new@69643
MASPTSPGRVTLQEEKEQLQGLNFRLEVLLQRQREQQDHINGLESENAKLRESVRGESERVRKAFESELSDARLIDRTANEKAQVQIVADRNAARGDDLAKNVVELTSIRAELDERIEKLQRERATREAEVRRLRDENDSQAKTINSLRAEKEALSQSLQSLRAEFEAEALLRVDVQNKNQSLLEEMAFNKQLYQEEARKAKQELEASLVERDNLIRRLKREFNEKLTEALAECREQAEEEAVRFREELEHKYKERVDVLRAQADRDANVIASLKEENAGIASELDGTRAELSAARARMQVHEERIATLTLEATKLRESTETVLQHKESILRESQRLLREKEREYDDLHTVKVQLDAEIAQYRLLLEGEEARLGLSPASQRRRKAPSGEESVTNTPWSSSRKRARVTRTVLRAVTVKSGEIVVQEIDRDGEFIRLANPTDKEVSLNGWSIKNATGEKNVAHKVSLRQSLAPGEALTVWTPKGKPKAKTGEPVWRSQPVLDKSGAQLLLLNEENEVVTQLDVKEVEEDSAVASAPEGNNCVIS